jgi:hypothetical protein
VVPPCSDRVSRARTYSRPHRQHCYRTITLFRLPFQAVRLLRCFSSPRSLPYPMHSDTDDPYGPGFPIRKSQDQSSVTSSPGHIAGSNVLHRLSTPRHPPCALGDLTAPTATRSELDWDKAGPPSPLGVDRKRLSAASKTARKSHGYSRSLGLDVHLLARILGSGQ